MPIEVLDPEFRQAIALNDERLNISSNHAVVAQALDLVA